MKKLLIILLAAAMGASLLHAEVTVYPAPKGSPVTSDYSVEVGGKPVDVYKTLKNICFATCDITGPSTVSVKLNFLPGNTKDRLTVHPLALGIKTESKGNLNTFQVSKPCSLSLLVNGNYKGRALHLFLNPPAEAPPENAVIYKPGKHVVPLDKPITLKDGQTLYIAGGAWVESSIVARNAKGIRIMGRGVLSQSRRKGKDYTGNKNIGPSGIIISNCRDVRIEGIVVTRTVGGWCSMTRNCDEVNVNWYHVVTAAKPSTDGFNPCNSRKVTVENSFFRTSDDCIAIKGNSGPSVVNNPNVPPASQPPIEDILIRGCTFWNDYNQVLVIGLESRAKYIRNITVTDCDVVYHAKYWRDLGVFDIIPMYSTEISNIRYEDCRVEHCENKLFLFRYVKDMYSLPGNHSFPGTISNIVIRNISVRHQTKGPRSEFSGWGPDRQVKDVTISGLRYGKTVVTDAKSMGLQKKHTGKITFIPPSAEK
jgi:hypothetical protein